MQKYRTTLNMSAPNVQYVRYRANYGVCNINNIAWTSFDKMTTSFLSTNYDAFVSRYKFYKLELYVYTVDWPLQSKMAIFWFLIYTLRRFCFLVHLLLHSFLLTYLPWPLCTQHPHHQQWQVKAINLVECNTTILTSPFMFTVQNFNDFLMSFLTFFVCNCVLTFTHLITYIFIFNVLHSMPVGK